MPQMQREASRLMYDSLMLVIDAAPDLLPLLKVRDLQALRTACDNLRFACEVEENNRPLPTFLAWSLPERAVPFLVLPVNGRFERLRPDGSGEGAAWTKVGRRGATEDGDGGPPEEVMDWEVVLPLPDLSDDHIVEVVSDG